MATSKIIKKTVSPTVKASAKTAAPASAAAASAPGTLTIVVVDAQSQPVSGARISISPSATTGTTDASGEFHFPLGSYPKYDITASFGSNSATVPYYVTPGGATRLVINPVYVKTLEQQRNPSFFQSGFIPMAGIAIIVAVAIVLAWKLFIRSRAQGPAWEESSN